jgi:hypothetical protein
MTTHRKRLALLTESLDPLGELPHKELAVKHGPTDNRSADPEPVADVEAWAAQIAFMCGWSDRPGARQMH